MVMEKLYFKFYKKPRPFHKFKHPSLLQEFKNNKNFIINKKVWKI